MLADDEGRTRVFIQRNQTHHPNTTPQRRVTAVYSSTTGWTVPTETPTATESTTSRITGDQLRHRLLGGQFGEKPTLPSARLGMPNRKQTVTIVTALLDIGRGAWPTYSRPLSKYHDAMRNVLSMRVPMVVFTDTHSLDFVQQVRDDLGLLEYTKIWNITMRDLVLYKHTHLFHTIIREELYEGAWKEEWDPAMKTHPEARSADYDMLVNSKTQFLFNASKDNPFGTENFAWIDAGYGGGDVGCYPADFEWYPILPENKISLIKLTPSYDKLSRYTTTVLYRRDEAVVSGGFLGGNRRAVARLHSAFHWRVVELLFRQRMVDDDQTTLTLVINEHPRLFNLVHGNWHDAFRLF